MNNKQKEQAQERSTLSKGNKVNYFNAQQKAIGFARHNEDHRSPTILYLIEYRINHIAERNQICKQQRGP